MARTRRTLRPSQSKPTPSKKPLANVNTKPTPPKKAKAETGRAKTTMTHTTKEPKKAGRHPDDDIFCYHFVDLCKYNAVHGMTKVSQTNAGKNQSLAEWVHYIRKRKACDKVAPRFVAASTGIGFEWTTGQHERGQFDLRFAELEEFKNNHGTVYFIGEDKKNNLKLATWTGYVKSTAIKMLKKEATNMCLLFFASRSSLPSFLFLCLSKSIKNMQTMTKMPMKLLLLFWVVVLVKSNSKTMMVVVLRKSNNQ
jgi:hypothetical protein